MLTTYIHSGLPWLHNHRTEWIGANEGRISKYIRVYTKFLAHHESNPVRDNIARCSTQPPRQTNRPSSSLHIPTVQRTSPVPLSLRLPTAWFRYGGQYPYNARTVYGRTRVYMCVLIAIRVQYSLLSSTNIIHSTGIMPQLPKLVTSK